jgi:anti-sigma B factor antagonist
LAAASEFQIHAGVDADVIAVTGEIDLHTSPRLRDTLLSHLTNDARDLTVDLSEVTFIDSTGLSVLIAALRRARSLGGDLRLRSPSRQTYKVLELTKLTEVFAIDGEVGT